MRTRLTTLFRPTAHVRNQISAVKWIVSNYLQNAGRTHAQFSNFQMIESMGLSSWAHLFASISNENQKLLKISNNMFRSIYNSMFGF